MANGFDYVGFSTLIVAVGTAAAAIIGAVLTGRVHGQVSTNGDPRTLGQIASDVAKNTPGAEAPGGQPPAA